jgi:uncharacterized protein YdeI (YjbR/CyaY-like superfamily)
VPGKRGSESAPIFFKGPEEYRAWLQKNHESAKELWIGFWKKSTGKPSLTWQQCVDESLCFGWIDGIRKSVDADSYKQRVTPRRPTSIWSQINLGRVRALTAEGRMRPAGLAAFEKRSKTRMYSFENKDRPGLRPADIARFRKTRKAWEFFDSQPPGYKRLGGWYVMSAKLEATRQRRLETLISESAAGRRLAVMTAKKPTA